ncbi:hypothetical protein C0J52_00468 [Blattella germanica]|nr:hypothetical protein C0J52_00468 [Blattella germanica]
MGTEDNLLPSLSFCNSKTFSASLFTEMCEKENDEEESEQLKCANASFVPGYNEAEESRLLSPDYVNNVKLCSSGTSLLVPDVMDRISLFSDSHKTCKEPGVHGYRTKYSFPSLHTKNSQYEYKNLSDAKPDDRKMVKSSNYKGLGSINTILHTSTNEITLPVVSSNTSIGYNLCQNYNLSHGDEDPLLSSNNFQLNEDMSSTSNSHVYNEFKLPCSSSSSGIGKISKITSKWTENPLTSSSDATKISKNVPRRNSSVIEYAIEKSKIKPPVLMGQVKRNLIESEPSSSYNTRSSDKTHNPISLIRKRPGSNVYSQIMEDICKKRNNDILNYGIHRHEPIKELTHYSNTEQQLRCNATTFKMPTLNNVNQKNNIYSNSEEEEEEDPMAFIRNQSTSNSDVVDETEDIVENRHVTNCRANQSTSNSEVVDEPEEIVENGPVTNCRAISSEKMSRILSTDKTIKLPQKMQEFICESTSSNSNTDLVVLAVFWRKGILGAAYYSADTSEIHVATDIVDVRPDFNILHSLYGLVHPSKVVVPAHMPDCFISVLKTLIGYDTPANDHPAPAEKKLHILPRKEYNLEACRRRVLLLNLPDEPKECNEDEHLVYLNSLMDMSNECMIQALGVLLKWLDVSWGFLHLEQDRQPSIMAVNTLSFPRPHPSGFKRGTPGSHREGLSIFGIFNRCKSPLGCNRMRLDVVQFCIHPNNEDTVGNMLFCLKHIKSITRIISRLTRLSASIREWKSLHNTLYHSILLGTICETIASKANLFSEIAGSMTDEMQQMEYSITRIIDFKESEKQNSFVVSLGVDEELDRKKLEYGGIPKLMTSVAHQELNNLPSFVNECSLVYIPEIGYLLAIFAWKENMSVEEWDIPGIEFMFKLGSIGHYKSARCRELDEMMGDTLVDIMKLESQILLRLVQFIQERIAPLHKLVNKAAELDCLIAFALVAKENNYRRPELTLSRVLEIRGGWHPLQSLIEWIGHVSRMDGGRSIKKIFEGKFDRRRDRGRPRLRWTDCVERDLCSLGVALIAFLAHIGSFVPAEMAKIGILDHIHTRIQTVESVSVNISAFVIDLRQMLMSLYNSSSSSLIIVDEFGKGTTEIDGLALLASCLDHFLSREDKCPHLFAATHFHNVVNLIRQSKYLKLQTMDCLFESDGQVVNLFKLKDGSVSSSCALAIAKTIFRNEISTRAQKIQSSCREDTN